MIPDVLVVSGEARQVASSGDLRGLTSFECHMLAILVARKRSTPLELANLLYARPDRVVVSLDRLRRRRLIRSVARSVAFRRGSFPLGVEVSAIEAKLRRWKDAVKQAVTYLTFANRAYVALPQKTLDHDFLPILDACIQNRIGLVSVSANNVELITDAPRHLVRNADWLWTVARVITRSAGEGDPNGGLTSSLTTEQTLLSTIADG